MAQKTKPAAARQSGSKSKPIAKSAPMASAKAKMPPREVAAKGQLAKAKAALKKETVGATKPAPVPKTVADAAAPTSSAKPRARKIAIDVSPNEALASLTAKWATLFKKAEQIESKPYNMKNVFEERTAITHKVLGWGYILANRNDRLEVLFKDGIKYLISNYKS